MREIFRRSGRLQESAGSRWMFLLFHLLLLSYGFGAETHLAGTVMVWFVMQVGIHAGYHRYYSHGSFRTSAWFEFLLGLAGCLAYQGGPLWWASKHRRHHQAADTELDLHSPTKGFWHAHLGWFLEKGVWDIDWKYVPDLQRPVPLWIETHKAGIHCAYIAVAYVVGGWNGVLNWWIAPIVLCWHTTASTNSICHLLGTHPFRCHPHETCMARNNFFVALANLGEGWHNNHHANPSFANHGFYRWYQLDVVYCVLLVWEKLGVVWDLRRKRSSRPSQSLPRDRSVRVAAQEAVE